MSKMADIVNWATPPPNPIFIRGQISQWFRPFSIVNYSIYRYELLVSILRYYLLEKNTIVPTGISNFSISVAKYVGTGTGSVSDHFLAWAIF